MMAGEKNDTMTAGQHAAASPTGRAVAATLMALGLAVGTGCGDDTAPSEDVTVPEDITAPEDLTSPDVDVDADDVTGDDAETSSGDDTSTTECSDENPCSGDEVCWGGLCRAPCDTVSDCGVEAECVAAPDGCACLGGACVPGTGACTTPMITTSSGTEVPPQTALRLSGAASTAAVGGIERWEWSVVQPTGSVSRLWPSADVEEVTFEANVLGTYVFTLRAFDAFGRGPCEDAELTVHATTDVALRIELVWRTPGDDDESDLGLGVGSDLDLHFLFPEANGIWFDAVHSCHALIQGPRCGSLGGLGAPSLDRDDTDGGGPENINFASPEDDAEYRVGVHYFDDWDFGPAYATLRVFVEGQLRAEVGEIELNEGELWDALSIVWPGGEVTARSEDGAPIIIPNARSR